MTYGDLLGRDLELHAGDRRHPAEVTCPNVEPYPGTARVADPRGHTASLSFTIEPCAAGAAP
jgi:hypothetical protein